jgi:sec-independent protein translocase protein TatA
MIPGLPQVGLMELVIVLSIIILFFGATRIPQLGRSLGSGIREFRKGAAGADDNDEVQDGKKDEEKLSLNGAAHEELPREEEDPAKEVRSTH